MHSYLQNSEDAVSTTTTTITNDGNDDDGDADSDDNDQYNGDGIYDNCDCNDGETTTTSATACNRSCPLAAPCDLGSQRKCTSAPLPDSAMAKPRPQHLRKSTPKCQCRQTKSVRKPITPCPSRPRPACRRPPTS